MPNHNDLPSRSLPPRAYDTALAAWLTGARQPGGIAVMWRLWLPYPRANALLADLCQLRLPLSAMGVVGERWVRLYLWQHRIMPDLEQRLLAYDHNAMLVDAEQIAGGPA